MATEFTVTNVTISVANLTGTAITFASLGAPVAGTLPTFTTAPVVYIRSANTNRYLTVDPDQTTTAQFVVIGGDVFSGDPPYTAVIGIITEDVTAAGAGVATAVKFPYYCSTQDVKDILTEFDRSFGTNPATVNLDNNKLRRFISLAYGRINGALASGRYTAPGSNTVKQVITNSLTAAETVTTLNQVEDGTKFAAGDTVRIHGSSGTGYSDEFTNVVAVSGDLVDVEFIKNSYDALSTIELCLEGMTTLRHLNSQGAALLATGGLTVGFATGENSKTSELATEFNSEIKAIEDRKMTLPGLPRVAPIATYVSVNSSSLYNDGESVFVAGTRF